MAATKLGVLVAGISGTVGGVTFSRNGSTTYAKIWSRSANPRAPLQSQQRGTFGSIPQLWRDLTPTQRTAWDTFAALPAQERTDRFGDPFFATGFNWFSIVNGWLINIERPTRVDPPILPRPSAPVITSLELPFLPQQTAKITYPSGEFDPAFDIIIEIVVAISRGRTVAPSNFKSLLQSQLPGDTETAFLIEYLTRNGLGGPAVKGFVRVYRQTEDGQRSSAGTASFLSEDAAPFAPAATNYTPPNDWAARGADLTGISDGTKLTLSTFIRLDGAGGSNDFLTDNSTGGYQIFINAANRIQVILRNTAFLVSYQFFAPNIIPRDGSWHHLMISVDTIADTIQMTIDTVQVTPTIQIRIPGITIDYSAADHFFAVDAGAAFPLQGCISMLYFNSTAALDLSNPNTLRLFIDDDGAPVDLGPNGEFPTGIVPIVFIPDGDASTNAGAGGNYINNAALGACADTPT